MKRAILAAFVFSFCAAGCNDDETDEGGIANEGGIAAKDFSAEATTQICAAFERCFGPASDLFFQGQTCAEGPGKAIAESLSDLEMLADQGRVEYNGAEAETCLPKFEDVACTELAAAFDTLCEAALDGTVDLGGDCDRDVECAGQSFCAFDDSCPGQCTALKSKGKSCTDEDECAAGLSCDTGTCEEPGAKGEACGAGMPDCALSLFCVGADEQNKTPGKCEALEDVFAQKEGQSCDFGAGDFCEAGLACVVTDATINGIETECQKPSQKDEKCNFGVPSTCPRAQYCNADVWMGLLSGTCVDLPEDGDDCAQSPGASPCKAGLVCVGRDENGEGGTCTPQKAVGDECESDDECVSSSCVKSKCVLGNGCDV